MTADRPPKRAIDGILLLDKPLGLSSNQALQQVKRLFRAAKAGHTGSLDPLATGVLPLCFGEATKLSGYLLDSDKRYVATARLGEKTSTGDAEGDVVARSDPSTITPNMMEAAMASLRGPIRQIPPMHSALKRDGKPLYELARAGIEVERAPREVTIHGLDLIAFRSPLLEFDVRCSKGTYIRTLAEDLAAKLGQCAHLTALRRVSVEPFDSRPLHTLEQLEQAATQGEAALDALLLEPGAALAGWTGLEVDADGAFYLGRGQAVRVGGAPAAGLVAVRSASGRLLGIGEATGGGTVAPRRWFTTS
jgi:tRNA pseudouridine55 synthase